MSLIVQSHGEEAVCQGGIVALWRMSMVESLVTPHRGC